MTVTGPRQRIDPHDPKRGALARDVGADVSTLDAGILALQPIYFSAYATGDAEWSDTSWTPVHRIPDGEWIDDVANGIERVASTLRFQKAGAYIVRAFFAVAVDTSGTWAVRLRDTRKGRTYAQDATPVETDGRFGLDALVRLHEPISLTLEYCTDGIAASGAGGTDLDGEAGRVAALYVARV